MDAGLAKVINSTVGTSSFKALDKLIYGRYGLIPSENTYFKIGNFETVVLNASLSQNKVVVEKTVPIASMTMWTEGGFSISATVNLEGIADVANQYPKYNIDYGFAVYKNGVLAGKVTRNKTENQANISDYGTLKIENLYFSTGDVLEIKLYFYGQTTNNYTAKATCSLLSTNPIIIHADAVEKPFDITYAE